MIKHLLLICVVVAMVASSCNIVVNGKKIKGNGKVSTQTFDLKNFTAIDAGSITQIYIRQDTAYAVQLVTDENLLRYWELKVQNGVLNISRKDGMRLSPSKDTKIYISMPEITSLDIGGASYVKTEGRMVQDKEMTIDLSGASEGDIAVRAPKLILDASGASTINIAGETRDMKAEASGASTIKAYDLKSENASVHASGASSAQVFASLSLGAHASGASAVKYKGNPTVTSDISGASSVKKQD